MPPCLTLSIIRYGSRVKWVNPGKGVAPSPTPWCGSYRKGSLRVTLDYSRQLYFTITSLNSEFSFSKTGCLFKAKELSRLDYLPNNQWMKGESESKRNRATGNRTHFLQGRIYIYIYI